MALFDLNGTSPLIKKDKKPLFTLDGFDDSDTQREMKLRKEQEEQQKQQQTPAFEPVKPPNFIDNTSLRNETLTDKAYGFLNKVNDTMQIPLTIAEKVTFLPNLVKHFIAPEQLKQEEENLAKHPIINTVGTIAGSIAPGTAIERAAVKLLPSVFKTVEGAKALSPLTQMAARGIAGASGYGAAEGLTEGIKDNMGVSGTLQNMGSKAYDYALGAGVLTPVLSKIGQGISSGINAYKTSQALSNIDNSMSKYASEGLTARPNLPPRNIPASAQSILRPQNEQGNINSRPVQNNALEQPLNRNELQLLPINLQPSKSLQPPVKLSNIQGKFTLKPIPQEVPLKSNGYYSAPEEINNKTWYHGTGTDNLTPKSLSPNATKIEGLFGHGIYLTDTPEIAKGYANARGKRTGNPSIYESKVNINKVLDLETAMPEDAFSVFNNFAKNLDDQYGYGLSEELSKLYTKGATGDEIYRKFANGISEISHQEMIPKSEFEEMFQNLSGNLKDRGYDAYTHIGGKRTGKDAHQVLIMLDPNGEFSASSQIGQVTKFNKLPDINNLPTQTALKPRSLSELTPQNKLKLLDINLQQHSAGLPDSIDGLAPTVNRIVNSTDRIPFKQKVLDTWNKLYTNWIDTQANIKPFAKATDNNAYINATNTKKVGGTVDYILNNALVNPEGKKINEGLKQIGVDIPKNKENEFMDYMLHRHNTDRYREDKPIFPDYNDSQSGQIVRKYEKANPEFKQLAARLDKFLDRFRNTWLRDTGLISNGTLMDWALKYPNYVPTFRKFTELEKGNPMTGAKKGYVNQVTPVRKATGSSRDIINPLESIMNMVNKTVRVARRNEVGQEILKSVRQNPDELKQFAEILPSTKAEAETLSNSLKSDTVEGAIDELDKGFMNPYMMKNKYDNVVTVMENGKPVFLKINDKRFLDAITSIGEQGVKDLPFQKPAQFVNNLFKTLVTQKNPIFAAKNILRDLPTSYVYGSEKNPLKFGKQYLSAAKDIATNKESYQQYKALGGQMGGFFKPNDLTLNKNQLLKKPGIVKSIGDFFETVNQATEAAPRLAEFKRILENTGDVQKALYGAGEVTTNFSRGGNMAKAVETYVPYFNASMQGLDRLIRAAVNNPKGFIVKGLVAATIPTAVQEVWNQSVDPEGYKVLDNRTKDAYFVFAQGDGNFIKIPKSRELGVLFSSLFQRLSRQSQGDSEAFKGFGNTVSTNFSPTNPIENNILAPATLNLKSNKDFADRPIVPDYMKDLSPRYQYDEKTSEIAKKIGDIGNLSPKQVDYIIRSYAGIIGSVLQPATTTNSINRNPLKSAFTADVAYSNKAVNDFYENMKKLNTIAADKNFTENIPSKKVTPEETQRNAFETASKYMSFIRKQNINATPEEKRQSQLKVLDIAKAMNDSLKSQQNPKLLLPKLKPKGYKSNQ